MDWLVLNNILSARGSKPKIYIMDSEVSNELNHMISTANRHIFIVAMPTNVSFRISNTVS